MDRPAYMAGRKGALSADQVRAIRAQVEYRRSVLAETADKVLAKRHGVSVRVVRKVVRGESYGWVR